MMLLFAWFLRGTGYGEAYATGILMGSLFVGLYWAERDRG